jgi:hypothetical protein
VITVAFGRDIMQAGACVKCLNVVDDFEDDEEFPSDSDANFSSFLRHA